MHYGTMARLAPVTPLLSPVWAVDEVCNSSFIFVLQIATEIDSCVPTQHQENEEVHLVLSQRSQSLELEIGRERIDEAKRD